MPTPCDTLLTCDVLMTQDMARTTINDAAIAITNGTITAVGPKTELQGSFTPASHLDLGPSLVMPGLINAHTHVSMTLLRGLADDLPLMDWLTKHIFPVEQKLTPELVRLGALLGCAEMLRTGTTCFCDMYLMEAAVAEAVHQSGIRARVGEVIFAFPSPAYPDLDGALDVARGLEERWESDTRIRTAVMPHAVYTTNPDLLQRSYALAEELDVPLHIHLAESTTETAQCLEQTGQRPVAYLQDLGLLGPRTLAAHCVDLTDDEISILADSGTCVSHCPESNMKLASGFCPAQKLLDAGAMMGIGTDGACSNNNLNMFTEMGTAALVQKVHRMDPTVLRAQTVLDMATLGGAASLHWPELGSIEAGKAADLIALDLTRPNMQPMYNPASHAVYATNGGEVRLTMVEGEVLYQDGSYTRLDYPALLNEIREAAHWVQKQL
ncbi:amidohydrolase [Desulfovibrio ferrophilus]|uniref:5-methylthioadenosine/S-adenosylhomocysteine deaminase n=1 Tax=Desulfovibrio ferrophilus TaxID=241368 RepID=A0A2Z6AWK1_9BACT|nr:amidohydrolase [Desulfovibrio ferrophilus]BBD07601.1 guanine deaminase [Desulfovibrio ferrophilus]